MLGGKGLFARPIEIGSSSKDLTVAGTGYAIATGLYGCIVALVHQLDAVINPEAVAATLVSTGGSLKVKLTGAGVFAVVWNDTALRDILGFTADLGGASSYTATYTPTHTWLSTNDSSDLHPFEREPDEIMTGVETADGLAAIKTGFEANYRVVSYPHEPKVNVYPSMGTTTYEQARSFQQFMVDAAQFRVADSDNPPTKSGFYFFPDHTDASTLVATPDDGGLSFNLATGADTYAYVCAPVRGHDKPTQSIEAIIEYYDVAVRLKTVSSPDWTAP